MAEKRRIVIAGARGVFGTHLANELRDRYEVVATTRETLDLGDIRAVAEAARDAFAFVCTAGPFQQLDRRIVRAAVEKGAHWLDIADDARWFFDIVDDGDLDQLARDRDVVVMPGLSTLPAISCALARRLMPASHVDITLFIGNDNAKGAGAIASGAALQTPDRELLRHELGIDATVTTRFEMPGAAWLMRALARLPFAARLRVARTISRVARRFRFGTSGGWVEARAGNRVERIAASQRMAILPIVFALDQIDLLPRGVHSPTTLDGEELLGFVDVS